MSIVRIAMVSEHANPLAVLGGVDAGGQNVHVAALSLALAKQGASVVVHTRRDDPRTPRQVPLGPGVVVDHVPAGPPHPVPKDELLEHVPAFAADLARQWSARPPDLVHAHFWMSGLACLAAARPLGIPVVQTFHALGMVKKRHQGGRDTSPGGRTAHERDLVAGVDRVVATCNDELSELLRLDADPDRVSVVPCGVDVQAFRPTGPVAPRAPGLHRVLAVGRLVERKGVGEAIAALGMLRRGGGPDTELVVVGGPPAAELGADGEAERLRRLAHEHGVADRVRFTGRVGRAELPALLRSADVAVCVPWYEPFGIVPLEAMACGVPVVASAVGGLLDTVVDGVTGVHVAPRRPAELASVLAELLPVSALRQAMGRAGAARALGHYSWARVATSTLAVYDEVLAPTVITLPEQVLS